MEQEELSVEENIPSEQQIEPFDWEDLLYEAWLEEHREHKRIKRTNACVSI